MVSTGHYTDDELANAVFLHGNEQPSMAALAAGKALPGIAYLTAAKERIRWLSRSLAAALAARHPVGEPEVEFQARLMDVKTNLPTENWHHSPTYEESPGRGTRYWVQYRKRYIYYTPPAQGIDLAQQQDAARWRWVREQNGVTVSVEEADDDGDLTFVSGHTPEELNAAIDSQRDAAAGVAS